MRRAFRISVLPLISLSLSACAMGTAAPPDYVFQPRPGQGQYQVPERLRPAPTPRLPAVDVCRSQMYAGLLGVNEGAIYIPGLPPNRRIIRPAVFEEPINEFMNGEMMEDTYVEVERYLPGQQLYAPSIRTVSDRIAIQNDDLSRLTVELDREGYVQEIRCG